jgi:DNA-binding PadR family transcriptional regulator
VSTALTPAELTLLGLLVERPRHGYELEEVISARGMREWTTIGFSSIYYVLGKLRERDLITEVESRGGGRRRARRVFAPTEAGRSVCADATEAALAELRPTFPPVLVGLANLPVLPSARVESALAQRAEALTERIAAISEASGTQPALPDFVRAIFDHALSQLVAEQEWLATHRKTLVHAAQGGSQP